MHQGGGKILLTTLLKVAGDGLFLLADKRLLASYSLKNIKFRAVKPSVLSRFFSEIYLYMIANTGDTVLCFGNLPPLFRLRSHAVVFVQNRYLIDKISLGSFPVRVRLRLMAERFLLKMLMTHANEFIVQTATMKCLLGKVTKGAVPIKILPFVANKSGYTRNYVKPSSKKICLYDFIYVASGEPHKNHENLLKAWSILGRENIFPSLYLTIDEHKFISLKIKIDKLRMEERLKIINAGNMDHYEILEIYKQSKAMIYPSKFESFGLPLIEARQAGLAVLASELDYVRDILDPEVVFDPESPLSIARAVKRFMAVDEAELQLQEANEFLASIYQRGGS